MRESIKAIVSGVACAAALCFCIDVGTASAAPGHSAAYSPAMSSSVQQVQLAVATAARKHKRPWGNRQNPKAVALSDAACAGYHLVHRWPLREYTERGGGRSRKIYGWLRLYRARRHFCATNVASNRNAGKVRLRTVSISRANGHLVEENHGYLQRYAGEVKRPARRSATKVILLGSVRTRHHRYSAERIVTFRG